MLTRIPRCFFQYETKGENSWNFPPHPPHLGLVPCEERPLKSPWWNSFLKSKIIHWDRGMTESKSDHKKCKEGDHEVFVQIFKFRFQVSSSFWRIYHLPLIECDVRRFLEERWVNLPLLCGLNSWSREEKAEFGWNYEILKLQNTQHLLCPLALSIWKLRVSISWQNKTFPKTGKGMEKFPCCLFQRWMI